MSGELEEIARDRRRRQILAAVKPLAVEFYALTGNPLGVTGEISSEQILPVA